MKVAGRFVPVLTGTMQTGKAERPAKEAKSAKKTKEAMLDRPTLNNGRSREVEIAFHLRSLRLLRGTQPVLNCIIPAESHQFPPEPCARLLAPADQGTSDRDQETGRFWSDNGGG